MALKKRYMKSSKTCKVTFDIPKELTENAKKVTVVGEFNNWDTKATPLRKLKDKVYKVTLDLEVGKEYQFRYLIDGKNWVNDWYADKYVSSPVGNCENSVVVL
ncbi:isoamylase early set domain-containing protein [candidate division KSB1 bacterium]|nr:isoamylase early set domain-containing protein [candidate division KSB1 bacterium]